MIGLFGGAFDPPHNGHVELVEGARAALGLTEVVALVTATPGHKAVTTPATARLELARAAFPRERVLLDEHPRTIDTLRAHPEWHGGTFLLGADEFLDFPHWKEPQAVLELVQLGVATRPGYPRERLEAALAQLAAPGRVEFFPITPMPIASRELRALLDGGGDVSAFVPAAVRRLIERDQLYGHGYTAVG